VKSESEAVHVLNPTLWRTCRALANRRRLTAFRALLRHPYRTVSDVASDTGLPESTASEYLRTLNARGLLDVRRTSRWVEYRVSPNHSIPFATPLVSALKKQLLGGDEAIETVFKDLTAFTHPRRVHIVRVLKETSGLTAIRLVARTGISLPAMRRHLRKLVRRQIVQELDNSTYVLCRARSTLADALIRIACGE